MKLVVQSASGLERRAAPQGLCPENVADEDRPQRIGLTWSQRIFLWAGWLLPQFVLMGSAFVGTAVPMPLGILARNEIYLPHFPGSRSVPESDHVASDIVFYYGPAREFCAREFHAGRLPLWQPANYLGAPFAMWPKYSPFELPHVLWPAPEWLAWMHLAEVVCCGFGGWLFLSRCVGLSFWAAALASWCMPLTGYMTVWLGFPLTPPVAWMPWLLTVIHSTVHRPSGWGMVGVAATTAVLLLSGAMDIGGQVLLTSGIYAVYQLGQSWVACRQWRHVVHAATGLAFAWGLGFVIAAPYWLPLVEYMRTGARMHERAAGLEERPPRGLKELACVIVPEAYGNSRPGSIYIRDGNLLESSAGGYAGLLAALFFAPLAFNDRCRRSQVIFWSCLAILSLGWQLNIPVLVQLLRLPGLNMLSHNRWVFATSFSLLVLAAIGLERFISGPIPFQRWLVWPAAISLVVGLLCLAFSLSFPPQIGVWLHDIMGGDQQPFFNAAQVEAIQSSFRMCFRVGAFLSLVACCGWFCVMRGITSPQWVAIPLGGLLLGELMWFAHLEFRARLADRALYYPRVSALEKLSELPAGRILGLQCLYPSLNQTHGLSDIRGHDAVEPHLLIKLLDAVRDPDIVSPGYARTFRLVPKFQHAADGQVMPPILNMLNVRYLVSREALSEKLPLVVQQDDYWVYENPAALPRAFVPRTVRAVPDDDQVLKLMARSDFDPREVGFLHTPNPPPFPEPCAGEVRLLRETPLEFKVEMQTDGLVVVSDLWDASWRATVDGESVDVHRANITLRGIPVGQGSHILKMTYAPKSVLRAFQASFAATGVLLLWTVMIWRSSRLPLRHSARTG